MLARVSEEGGVIEGMDDINDDEIGGVDERLAEICPAYE